MVSRPFVPTIHLSLSAGLLSLLAYVELPNSSLAPKTVLVKKPSLLGYGASDTLYIQLVLSDARKKKLEGLDLFERPALWEKNDIPIKNNVRQVLISLVYRDVILASQIMQIRGVDGQAISQKLSDLEALTQDQNFMTGSLQLYSKLKDRPH